MDKNKYFNKLFSNCKWGTKWKYKNINKLFRIFDKKQFRKENK